MSAIDQEHHPGLPANTAPVSFGCRCLNLKVDGRVDAADEHKLKGGDGNKDSGEVNVYLPPGSEGVKFPDYVTYEQEGNTLFGSSDNTDDSCKSWRKCYICGTTCYETTRKPPQAPAAEEEWVTIDLAGSVVYGEELGKLLSQEGLPFSNLLIDASSAQSNFGRPPTNPAPSSDLDSYEPATTGPYISSPHDPFFLPPPFIPSNSHLKDLCDQAESHLKYVHYKLEEEVRHFISERTHELRDMEEKVRGEVETLWGKYQTIPGNEGAARERSASTSRTRESISRIPNPANVFSPPKHFDGNSSQPSPSITSNPIMQSATAPATSAVPNGTSLLAQSLSASSFYPAPSSNLTGEEGSVSDGVRDEMDDTISQVAKTYGTKGDSRAVAMSYVFSSLAENMGGPSQAARADEEGETLAPPEAHGKDSWIDDETENARRMPREQLGAVAEENEGGGRTPRATQTKELYEDKERKDKKGKGRVKFEEPEKPEKTEEPEEDDDDYVFDFELDDNIRDKSASAPLLDSSRSRNLLETNLSHTFAADLPSHRAAWRRFEQNGSMYEALRRGQTYIPGEEDEDDESQASKLATSVPIQINPIRAGKASAPVAFERKTSLSDRQGLMVPRLKGAMRESGVEKGNTLGLGFPTPRGRTASNSQRRNSRSASASRETEAVKSYKADPGAVFESLADTANEDDEDGAGAVQAGEGTLKEKGFVPPHVLARKADKEQLPNVGWRSMAS
ncbi:hypothetical protein L198_05550 [Cryptococcus wingfieldii CBS 7118]|uniref:Uncharacterized protein n=1 Tax=Cryptococcus wingfieldii CBS 7118 TaxID=1295528 RepID=A0A1E3IXX5_9TREE|nr:hypothetical protein L198_05550 [Cryptococcus wingfieldii CBS 7118]ODN92756.1 hypothetical protein L198_05550 [Cryptococcus wingfieldii CBS 7118]